jgi:hypothetical protein
MRTLLLAGVASIALGVATAPAQAQFWSWSEELDDCYDEAEDNEDALVVQCLHNNIKDPNGGDNDWNFQLIKQKADLKLQDVDADDVEDADSRIIQLGYNEVDDDDNNHGNSQKIFQHSSVTENGNNDGNELAEDVVVTFQGAINEVEDGDHNTQVGVQSATVDIQYD